MLVICSSVDINAKSTRLLDISNQPQIEKGKAIVNRIEDKKELKEKKLQVLFQLTFDNGFQANVSGTAKPENDQNQPDIVDGINGKAVSFSTGKVLQYPADQNIDKKEGSIGMWIKLKDNGAASPDSSLILFSEDGGDTQGNNSFKIEMYKKQFIRFSIENKWDSSIFYNKYYNKYVNYHKIDCWQNEWHHFLITWNCRKGPFLYIDGIPSSIGWIPEWIPKAHANFFIGAGNAKGEHSCQSAIDEFTIYNRELTDEEVKFVFLKYGSYDADISLLDPFLTVDEPSQIRLALKNHDVERIILKDLSFTITDNTNKVVDKKALDDQTIEKLSHQVLKVPVQISSPGTYTFTLYYLEDGKIKKVAEQFDVLEKYKKLTEKSANLKLVTEVDVAKIKPIAEAGGTQVISGAIGKYLEGGLKIHDRFAVDFEVSEVEVPHLAVITYPDDKPRTMEIILQHFNKHQDYQSQTGVMTGEEYPLSNKMREFRIVFWPHEKRQAFIFMTAENNYPAAVSDIKIYKIKDFGISSEESRFSGSVPSRSTGLYYEDPVLFESFGTSSDKKGFMNATDRLINYMKSIGQSEFEYPLAWYSGPLYGTSIEPFQPDVDGSYGGQRPHPKGYTAYLLKRLGEQNIKFTAGLHIHTLPSLNKYALTDTARINHGEETAININKDGELWYGHWHGADPNFNAADPRVMSSVNDIVDEICDRYSAEPAFDGISLVISRPKLFSFGSLASGYNDINLQRFQENAGIKIPCYILGNHNRFKESYEWLMSNPSAKIAWIDWRCKILYEHYSSVSKTMASYRPDLKLKLNVFVHLTNNKRLADYLSENPVDVMKEMGIDPELYKDQPNIVMNYTYVPADLRWARSNYSFPAKEANRTVLTAPEIVASMQDLSNMRVTIHDRYWEDAIAREDPLKGLKAIGVNEVAWRVSTLNASGCNSLEPYVFSLNYLDATSIVKGGFLIGTHGMEEELMKFSKAFQALPSVKFDDIPNITDPIRVRQKVVDGKMYFYVLNSLPKSLKVNLKLKKASEITDLVENKTYKKSRSLLLDLAPYDLRVFISSSANQDITCSELEVPEEWLEQVYRSLENLEQLAGQKNPDSEKYKPYLDFARECWDKKHYARLYFLLQEGWAKELKIEIKK
ncbi:MAG: LamG-like jellyroll fold domain-containing protein [Bacteroidota bacterium]|nr:LamG-like jellyroll fold domain-containing protein [Bacteroidota bacterium]